jgi:predicted dehydrogenase
MDNRVRLGIIGCGNIMRLFHLPQYPRIPEARVAAIYDVDAGRAQSAAELLDQLWSQEAESARGRGDTAALERCIADRKALTICDSMEAFWPLVDAVDIATPPRWHMSLAKQVLEHGLCAMVEKPMARTWWEAAQLVPEAKSARGFYQHNENWVYNPVVQMIRHLVESGAIGRVQRVQWFQAHTGPDAFTPFWFCDPQASGGGSLTDWGVHSTGAAWYLAGFDKEPIKVRSDGIGIRAGQRILGGMLQRIQVEDDALLEVTLRDPATGADTLLLVEGTWSRFAPDGKSNLIRVEGTRGEIEVEGSGFGTEETVTLSTRFEGQRSQHLACSRGRSLLDESFLHELRNFVCCVAENQPPLVDYTVGLQVMAILSAGYLSELRGRQSVTMDDLASFCDEIACRTPPDRIADEIIRTFMGPYAA